MRSDLNPNPTSLRIVLLRVFSYAVLAFIYLPLLTIVLYAFTVDDVTFAFPPSGFTTKWFVAAAARADVWAALWLSIKVAVAATSLALVLGTLAALALSRLQWRYKDSMSILFILPIALPGILTGLAMLTTFRSLGWSLGTWTIVVGHTTFCIVVVYNNVVARLRRLPASMMEASMDLGANPLQTFWWVMLPNMRSALLAGGLLAFALSFDELIVTLFTAGNDKTLPIWMFNELFRPRERPVTNVVATVVMILTLIPVYMAYRAGEQDRE